VIQNIVKYRAANGKFYKKEDFKKIYALNEIDYLRLENYIQIADNKKNTDNKLSETQKYTSSGTLKAEQSLSVDVNQATTDEWKQLRGIGSVLATRICEYRDKLGGFVSLDQLKDVYGLPDSTYYSIIPSLRLSSVSRKLHINKASITELTHPYLSRKQVDVILRYRLNHGAFYSIEDIKKTGVFTDDNLKKLNPYLDYTH
jgi:competence protein ComEA